MKRYVIMYIITFFLFSCKKNTAVTEPPKDPGTFNATEITINGTTSVSGVFDRTTLNPIIKVKFPEAINTTAPASNILFNESTGAGVPFNATIENGNTLVIKPNQNLTGFKNYAVSISESLKSVTGAHLQSTIFINFNTGVDDSNKFPEITDQELLTKVQQQTFKYFWDFGHPVSGMARERNTSGDLVTSGGTGFGIMAIITGIHRNFITRNEGLTRLQKIVAFLKNKAVRFHGAYPHWIDGNTGAVIPFSSKDNGADLVETSLLMQGLICARQYFDGSEGSETTLRNDISTMYNDVEWDWFRKDNSNALYWHWSPNFGWDMNMQVRGWNEALITYVLAAASPTHTIPKSVYDNGWANNGAMKNGASFYGVQLPLGPAAGGPLFFSHYSFLGINPIGLSDAYANYETQTKAHSLIHYNYAKANPKNFYGYGENCWGLTASDDIDGYLAHDPINDNGVVSPTAALSSFPYTPEESMKALKYYYYKLGDKIWNQYGFVDAFSLHKNWFANSTLAIDQGPIIIMIENYRSKLLWNLFMSAPEIKTGMQKLGFTSPNL